MSYIYFFLFLFFVCGPVVTVPESETAGKIVSTVLVFNFVHCFSVYFMHVFLFEVYFCFVGCLLGFLVIICPLQSSLSLHLLLCFFVLFVCDFYG